MRKVTLILSLFIAVISCSKFDDDKLSDIYGEHYFNYTLNLENFTPAKSIGDTLWFSFEIPQTLTSESGEEVELSNATFIFEGRIDQLQKRQDSSISENFTVLLKNGEVLKIETKKIGDYANFLLKSRFGLPESNYKHEFGLVINAPGIYAGSASITAYFGKYREDYSDFSPANQMGYFTILFNTPTYNSNDLLNNLPEEDLNFWETTINNGVKNKTQLVFQAQ